MMDVGKERALGVLREEYPDLALEVESATHLPTGRDNLNLKVKGSGGVYVLRQYFVSSREEVEVEVSLLKNLNRIMFPTPKIFRTRWNGFMTLRDGVPHVLFEYVPNCAVVGVGDLEGVIDLAHQLHILTWQFEAFPMRSKFVGIEERFRAYLDPRPDQGDLREMRLILDWFNRDLGPNLRSAMPHLRSACVHYDLNPGNLLMGLDGRLSLIDFDEFIRGPVILDLCSLVHYWCLAPDGSDIDLELARRIVDLYDARTRLSAEERLVLPHLIVRYQILDCLKFFLGMVEEVPEFRLSDSFSFAGLKTLVRRFEAHALTFVSE